MKVNDKQWAALERIAKFGLGVRTQISAVRVHHKTLTVLEKAGYVTLKGVTVALSSNGHEALAERRILGA